VTGTLIWIALGFAFGTLVVCALCRAAANGDRDLLAPHPDEQPDIDWSQVAHLNSERRRRRSDIRNGLDGAA
jgi:hypothetical protein